MRYGRSALLLSLGLVIAGCSSSTGKESTDETTVKELLQQVVDSAEDDAGLTAWKSVLSLTQKSYENSWTAQSDEKYYEYKDDEDAFVTENFTYLGSRYDAFLEKDKAGYYVSMTDYDDSYNTFITGDAIFARYATDPVEIYAKLSETSGSEIKGTYEAVSTGFDDSVDTASLNNLIDAAGGAAYYHNADPIRYASLYEFSLSETDSGFELKAEVKDLEKFQEQVSNSVLLTDLKTNKDVIGLDEVKGETYTYTFNSDGVLTSVTNEVLHALSALDHSTYVDVSSTTAIANADDNVISPDAFSSVFEAAIDGTWMDNRDFTIENWK
jgi:hypothetical protein